MRKILFISHDASRTGAPILLLRLIEQIKLSSDFEILILLKNGGELEQDFEELGKTFKWNYNGKVESFVDRLKNKTFKKIGIKRLTRQEKYHFELVDKLEKVDFIFNNTITNASLLRNFSFEGKKVFSYFHELQMVTEMSAKANDVKYLAEISDKIFVPSLAVKKYLMENFNLGESKISLLKYIIPKPKKETSSKSDFDLHNNKFLVGFGGTLHWRKGYEFLPLLAKYIVIDSKVNDIHFVWIGANKHSIEFMILKNDLMRLNLFHFFTFIEPKKNIETTLSQLDIFVLPSREDAFPLIVLEASFYEVPCIYFSNAGGIGEFLENDAGIEVNYLDLKKMSQKIIELKTNENLRVSLGRRAKEKIVEYTDGNKVLSDLLPFFKS